jgi:site-specific recombinase XerC
MELLGVAELMGHETLDTTRGYVKLAGRLGDRVAQMFGEEHDDIPQPPLAA